MNSQGSNPTTLRIKIVLIKPVLLPLVQGGSFAKAIEPWCKDPNQYILNALARKQQTTGRRTQARATDFGADNSFAWIQQMRDHKQETIGSVYRCRSR